MSEQTKAIDRLLQMLRAGALARHQVIARMGSRGTADYVLTTAVQAGLIERDEMKAYRLTKGGDHGTSIRS